MRDVESVHADQVVEAIAFGDGAILIEQKREGNRMLLQVCCRFEKAFTFLSSDVKQIGSGGGDAIFERLKLSHALDAVGSPGAAQKFQDDGPALPASRQRKFALAIGRGQGEVGRRAADGKGCRSVLHPFATLDRVSHANNNQGSTRSSPPSTQCSEASGALALKGRGSRAVQDRVNIGALAREDPPGPGEGRLCPHLFPTWLI